MTQSLPLAVRHLSQKQRHHIEHLVGERYAEMYDRGLIRERDSELMQLNGLKVLLSNNAKFSVLAAICEILTGMLLYGFFRVRHDNIPPDVMLGVGGGMGVALFAWLLCWAFASRGTTDWWRPLISFPFSPIAFLWSYRDLRLVRQAINTHLG